MEIGAIKYGGKIGKLIDDNNYFLGNKGGSFQGNILKNILDNEKLITNIMQKFCHWQMN